MTLKEVNDLNLSYQDLEVIADSYINLCFSVYRQAKEKCPDNRFVKSMGGVLFKRQRFSAKQLQALMDTINGEPR